MGTFKDVVLITIGLTILVLVMLSSMHAGFVDSYTERSLEIPDFENVYHEGIKPFDIVGVNYRTKILYVRVDNAFTNGSDGACESFGVLMNNMLEDMPEGWGIFVTNEFVPSSKNPIDLGWSRTLAKGY